jgi:hypothetical protein
VRQNGFSKRAQTYCLINRESDVALQFAGRHRCAVNREREAQAPVSGYFEGAAASVRRARMFRRAQSPSNAFENELARSMQ